MVKEKLITTLENEGFTVFQASAVPVEVPTAFVTFHIHDTYDLLHLNNRRMITNWVIDVRYYSNSPIEIEQQKYVIRNALENVGFVANGIGFDILAQNENNKLGWECDFDYMEFNEG